MLLLVTMSSNDSIQGFLAPPALLSILKSLATSLSWDENQDFWDHLKKKSIMTISFSLKHSLHLDINIKSSPSQTAVCIVIWKLYLSKMQIHSVVPILQTVKEVSKWKRRKTCCAVHLREASWWYTSDITSILGIKIIQEISGATKSPILIGIPKGFGRTSFNCCISFIQNFSFAFLYFQVISTRINMKRTSVCTVYIKSKILLRHV